ncbi:hypothetical protein [Brevundimonas phoenicis]|uniref:hypothetical protein n=1 Tax=unclassified Brevundimonas TaxID=2622653 RepID=UPI0039A26F9E
MTKLFSVMSSVAALAILSASPVLAGNFKTAPGNYTAQGPLLLYQTIDGVVCNVTAKIRVDSNGDAFITSLVFGPGDHPLCGSLIRPLAPPPPDVPISHGPFTPGSDEVDISFPVNIQAGAGTCAGTLGATLTLYWGAKGPNRIGTNPVATVTGTPLPCTVTGDLTITPDAPTTGELRL